MSEAVDRSDHASTAGRRLDLKVGFSCNNRCRFCVQGEKRERYPDKSTAELLGILEESRASTDELVFTGGEVTIRVDLPELVRGARRLGYRVIQLQTNGRALCNLPLLDRLLEAGITEVSPSLHGASESTHDQLTRSPGSFRQTVRGIRNARARGLPVISNSVITKSNHHELERLAMLLLALDVQQFQLAFVHPLGTAGTNFEHIVPRFPTVMSQVFRALDVGLSAGLRCMTEGIPLCFLAGYSRLAAEWLIPPTKIIDAERVVEDYGAVRRDEAKAKGPFCVRCPATEQCEGPWREYPEHFGWDEFEAPARRLMKARS